jgi:hypothetical protein
MRSRRNPFPELPTIRFPSSTNRLLRPLQLFRAKPPWLIILFVNVQKIYTILVISKGEKQSAHVK